MSNTPAPSPNASQLHRTYGAPPNLVWEMLTTPSGLEEWMMPDGFESRVTQLELKPGGRLRYALTASAPEQVAFVQDLGLALSSEFQRTYTEVSAPSRLAYLSVIDFIPGEQPYEHLTVVEIEPAGNRTTLAMTLDPLHDKTWTEQYRDHRDGELDKLAAAIERRSGSACVSV
jgi:uncharacterized protein YndB with AHSA1/START domain